jgi:hypothetical protein
VAFSSIEEKRAYERERYARLRESERARMKVNSDNARKRNREYVWELKSNPCTDCGQIYHPTAMQFDHTDTDKEFNVSDMVKNGFSLTRIQEEINKCELVCANCHAVRTYERRVKD